MISEGIENKRSSIWQPCRHWWQRKLSLRQLTVPPVTTRLSNWWPFVFSGCNPVLVVTFIIHLHCDWYLSVFRNLVFISTLYHTWFTSCWQISSEVDNDCWTSDAACLSGWPERIQIDAGARYVRTRRPLSRACDPSLDLKSSSDVAISIITQTAYKLTL